MSMMINLISKMLRQDVFNEIDNIVYNSYESLSSYYRSIDYEFEMDINNE